MQPTELAEKTLNYTELLKSCDIGLSTVMVDRKLLIKNLFLYKTNVSFKYRKFSIFTKGTNSIKGDSITSCFCCRYIFVPIINMFQYYLFF